MQVTGTLTTFANMKLIPFHLSVTLMSCALLSPGLAEAQSDLTFGGNIPVARQGVPLPLAWAGGINYTQVGQIDLDQDGLKDLFFFDRVGNKVTTLLNTGGSGTGSYALTRDNDRVWP